MRTTAGRSLLAALAAALLIPAQAPAKIPADAIAVVGSQPITRATFDHWFRIAAISLQSRIPHGRHVPHRFGHCRPHHRRCRIDERALRDEVMPFLISAWWIEGEATLQGISVTDAEVTKQFDITRRESFDSRKAFRKFLRQSGMTVADLHYRVRVQLLSDGVREKVIASAPPVTDEEVAAYSAANGKRFELPERRDLRIVLTRTRRRALRALKLLRQGVSWRRVARRFSIDQASKNQGGRLPGVAKGQQEKRFDDAVFTAPKGKPRGPVRTMFGYYVFEVTRITPARRETLEEVTPTIRELLTSRHRNATLDDFIADFQQRWRAATVCRSGFITEYCGNARRLLGRGLEPAQARAHRAQLQLEVLQRLAQSVGHRAVGVGPGADSQFADGQA